MEARRVDRIADGEMPLDELVPGERAIAVLAKKSVRAPRHLSPADLTAVAAAYGVGGAMEITAVVSSFHFVNRIAELVGIQSELPIVQRRWRWLRRLGVRLQGIGLRRMFDLRPRETTIDAATALAEVERVEGPLPAGFRQVLQAPNVAASLLNQLRGREVVDADLLARVAAGVVAALPASDDEVEGFHPRPSDPVDALVFVGTRYAYRTTDEMVEAIRNRYGFGDLELTDLFFAIAATNARERMHRLLSAPIPQ